MPRKTNSQRLDELEKDVQNQGKCLARIEGELHNGLHSRVKLVERMQWWQIGLLVIIIGAFTGGMWTMLRQGSRTARENQKLLLDHVRSSGQVSPRLPLPIVEPDEGEE